MFKFVRSMDLVAFDSVLGIGKVVDGPVLENSTSVLRKFSGRHRESLRIRLELPPIGDGATLTQKRT